MSAWAQVDAFRSAAEARAAGGEKEWRAFARVDDGTLWGKLRFRGKPNDSRIKIEVPCSFVPGKWRAKGGGYVDARGLVAVAASKEAEAIAKGGKVLLTKARAQAVLVAWDAWVEKGCPRMTRPTVIP